MRHALMVLILALSLIPQTVFAQSADELQKEGTAAYLAGDYATAILKFTQAYDIDPNPIFQYNLSLCYGKLGNFPKALESADRAQENVANLPAKIVPKNQGRGVAFAVRLSGEEVGDEIKAEEQSTATCETDGDCDGGFFCSNDQVCVQQGETPDPVTRERRLGPIGFVGIGLMVVGAGAATGALIVDAGLAPDLKRLEEDGDLTDEERDSLSEDVARRQGQGRVLIFVGAGVGLVGAGLLVYDLLTVEEVPVAIVPTIGRDNVGATLRYRF